jgi:hypothetical protein
VLLLVACTAGCVLSGMAKEELLALDAAIS